MAYERKWKDREWNEHIRENREYFEREQELSKKLKPCPFCGESAILCHTNDNHRSPYVACNGAVQVNRTKSCYAQQAPWRFKTDEEAIEAWNRRI